MRYTVIIEDKSLPMFPRKITVNSSRAMIAHKDVYFRDVEDGEDITEIQDDTGLIVYSISDGFTEATIF